MTDLMLNSANFALTDTVYKSRSIAQGQDSERKSSNFRLADHSLGVCPAGTALLYTARFTSNCPPEMLRLSGMPIKIKDRPFKFGTRL